MIFLTPPPSLRRFELLGGGSILTPVLVLHISAWAPRPSRLSATPSVFFYKSDTAKSDTHNMADASYLLYWIRRNVHIMTKTEKRTAVSFHLNFTISACTETESVGRQSWGAQMVNKHPILKYQFLFDIRATEGGHQHNFWQETWFQLDVISGLTIDISS